MQLNLNQIATMCGGVLSDNSDSTLIVNNVVIDSREVVDGSLFVAIVGETNDGHKYVLDSLKSKTIGAIVNKSANLNVPNLILVDDTTIAIGLLASKYRDMFDIPVVAITGSNGKTTIKEMLKIVCEIEYGASHVLASKSSFNNQWGMPLTLLQLNHKHKVAIIEMGMNHHGELDYLTKLAKPTIAVVNNVLLSHAGFFKNLADIAKAKGEIYNGLLKEGVALVNRNIPESKLWDDKFKHTEVKVVDFGDVSSGCYLKESSTDGSFTIATNKGDISTKLQVLGIHNQYNAVTVTALALQLGCNKDSIIKGLESFTAYKHRLEQKKAFNGALIIDDSYNANPDSVKAAIKAIKDLPKPHWLIFGDLKELGEFAIPQHVEMGNFIRESGINMLLTIGELAVHTGNSYSDSDDAGMWAHFENNDEIAKYCKRHLPAGAILLIKGSNSMKLWQIADILVDSHI